jgi:hypothetical protein
MIYKETGRVCVTLLCLLRCKLKQEENPSQYLFSLLLSPLSICFSYFLSEVKVFRLIYLKKRMVGTVTHKRKFLFSWLEHLTANAKVATDLGPIPESHNTV